MSNTIKISIDCFPPHDKSPDFIKWTSTFILSNDDFDLIEKYKRACNGNGKENFIPIQIKETKSGKNMLFVDTYKLDYQIKQLEETPVSTHKMSSNFNDSDISIEGVPF